VTLLSAAEVRTKLAEFVRERARWRESKVHDEADERDQRSAERLWRLAAHIEALPDDDPRLAALSRVHAQHAHDAFVAGDDASYLVSRFSFDSADATQGLDEFLTKLVTVLVAEDRRDQLDQLDVQLRSKEVDALLDEFGDDEAIQGQ
jgi:hypothetical protein